MKRKKRRIEAAFSMEELEIMLISLYNIYYKAERMGYDAHDLIVRFRLMYDYLLLFGDHSN